MADTNSMAYLAGAIFGGLIVFVIALTPIGLGWCLAMAVYREKKTGWIIGAILTSLPTLALFACLGYGVYIGVTKGQGNHSFSFGTTPAARNTASPTNSTTTASSGFRKASGIGAPIQGTNYDYTLSVPDENQWRVNRKDLNFDMIVFCRDVYVGVDVARVANRTSEQLCRNAILHLTKVDPNSTFTDQDTVMIDGMPWTHLNAQATIQGLKITYSYYVHGGPNGAVRIVAWTGQSLYDQEKATIEQISRSFHTGEGLKAIKAEPPTPSPAAAAPSPATNTPAATAPSEPAATPAAPTPGTSTDSTPDKPAVPANGISSAHDLS